MKAWLKNIFLIFSFIGSTSAYAAYTQPTLLTYDQLMTLMTSDRARYIRGVRNMMLELDKEFKKQPGKSSFNFSFLSETALADDPQACVYAGWIGTLQQFGDHDSCIPPKVAHETCGAGQIACNPALFGRPSSTQSLCVATGGSATQECMNRAPGAADVAKQYLSDESLEKNWNDLKAKIEPLCDQTQKQQGPCHIIKRRMAALEKEIPAAQNPQTLAQASTNPSPVGKRLCKNRDAGDHPVSGIFCALCSVDTLTDNLPEKLRFRSSANWAVFLSVANTLCAGSNTNYQPETAAGLNKLLAASDSNPGATLNMIMTYGTCEEKSYLPYSDQEPAGLKAQMGSSLPQSKNDAFYNQFGLNATQAKALFCPGGRMISPDNDSTNFSDQYSKTVASMASNKNINPHFIQCAKEAADRINKMHKVGQSCQAQTTSLTEKNSTSGDKDSAYNNQISAVRRLLGDTGYPTTIIYDKGGTTAPQCTTFASFNDQTQKLYAANSWGGKPNSATDMTPVGYSYTPSEKRTFKEVEWLKCDKRGPLATTVTPTLDKPALAPPAPPATH